MTTQETTSNTPDVREQTSLTTALQATRGRLAALLASFALVLAILDAATGFVTRLGLQDGSFWFRVTAATGAFIGVSVYVRESIRLKRVGSPRPITVFLGPDSFSESDRDRFFGRETETDVICRRLADPRLSYLIIYGESGCGKTSLIRAGVIPRLAKQYDFLPVYVRLFDHPERAASVALARLALLEDSLGQNPEGEPRGLPFLLKAACSKTGKTLVLFFDQFEEFFTLPAPEQERQSFLHFVRDCAQSDGRDAKLVFGVRRDFFDRMSVFDDYIQDVFTRSNRFPVDVFDTERARTVVSASLLYANKLGSTLQWKDGLIDRILSDLKFLRNDGGNRRSLVLPAELQIVCQMVQLRGWSEASQYPGKYRLISDYVSDAIESSPSREQASRILLALVSEDGVTRAKAMSITQIAHRSSIDNVQRVASYLRYFDGNCRLTNQVANSEANGKEPAYELAHDYLVGVLNNLSSKLLDKTRRANLLVDYLRERISYGRSERISTQELWLIWFHASHSITPEVRRALRRKMTRVVSLSLAAVCGLLCIAAVRHAVVHFDIQYEPQPRIVLKKGTPFLMPLLGSESIVIDTGIPLNSLDMNGKEACHSKAWVFTTPVGDAGTKDLERWRVDEARTEVENIDRLDEPQRQSLIQILAAANALDETTLRPIRALVEPAGSFASVVPAQAILSHSKSSEAARAALLGLLNGEDPSDVAIAAKALVNVDAFDDGAMEVLGKRLARLTGDAKRDKAETFLLETLNELLSSTKLSRKPLAAGLRARLNNNSPFIVADSAILLGDDRAVAAARSLLRQTNETAETLGVRAMIELGRPDEDVLATCRKLLRSTKNRLRINAANCLITYGTDNNDASAALTPVLQHGDGDEIRFTAAVLGKTKQDREHHTETLMTRLDDQSSEVAAASAEALAGLGVKDPKVLNVLRRVATQGTLESSLRAVLGMRRLGFSDPALISQIRVRYENGYLPRAKIFDFFVRGSTPSSALMESLGGDDDYSSAETAYARSVLLVDDEAPVAAIRRLLAELESPSAEMSVAYRKAIQIALATVAANDSDNTSALNARTVLRAKLDMWVKSPQLHRRLAAVETLTLLRKMSLGTAE